jgi:two-component system nitrogen regulation response regulator GlnG
MRELQSRDWYGNVRELRGALEHALVLAREAVILPEHLPPPLAPHREMPSGAAGEPTATERIRELIRKWTEERLKAGESPTALYEELLALVEPPFLRAALLEFNGQCAAAARIVGLHRTTLKKKLDQYGIEGKE